MSNLNKGTEEYEKYDACCDFIIQEMNFYSVQDFINNHKRIKMLFCSANILVKRLYLWYVYSRDISMKRKNQIWSFLNTNKFPIKNLTKK